MSIKLPKTAVQILNDEFLVARSKLLEVAAVLDRIERAEGDVAHLRPMQLIEQGIGILSDDQGDKAARLQLLMSRQYNETWPAELGVELKQ